MGDTLLYRYPGEDAIENTGRFKPVDSFKDIRGFIVCSFDNNSRFVFEEAKSESFLHPEGTIPYVISSDEYAKEASIFLDTIKNEEPTKAVYSRVKKVHYDGSLRKLFFELSDAYPDAFVYLISSENFGTWIGATPEVLIKTGNGVGETYALAGTKSSTDMSEWGGKEVQEQEYVANYLEGILKEIGVNYNKSELSEKLAGPVKHLINTFTFNIDEVNINTLINKLHPTPAVCGLPKDVALELIAHHEKHDRELYAGYLGRKEEDSISLYVNLRCGKHIDDNLYLFSGGGFTKDSIVRDEWTETENKAKTILKLTEN